MRTTLSGRYGLDLELIPGGARSSHASLQTRVGIATRLVIVGDLIGSGDAQERGIVGETQNLGRASKVLRSRTPMMVIVVGESTRRLTLGLFELEDVAQEGLKGITGSIEFSQRSAPFP